MWKERERAPGLPLCAAQRMLPLPYPPYTSPPFHITRHVSLAVTPPACSHFCPLLHNKILYSVRFQCYLSSRAVGAVSSLCYIWRCAVKDEPAPHTHTHATPPLPTFSAFCHPPLSNPKHTPFSFHFAFSFLLSCTPFLLSHLHPLPNPLPLPLFLLCILCNWGRDPASASSAEWLLFLWHHLPQCQAACWHLEVHLSFAFYMYPSPAARVTLAHMHRLAQCAGSICMYHFYLHSVWWHGWCMCEGITFSHKPERGKYAACIPYGAVVNTPQEHRQMCSTAVIQICSRLHSQGSVQLQPPAVIRRITRADAV